jgi:hypothetical protein
MNLITRFTFYSLMIGLLLPALSLARTYQVNVIVFKHMTSDSLSAENWACNFISANTRGATNLLDASAATPSRGIHYRELPSHLQGLQFEASQLQKQSDYQILAHLSWSQPSMKSPAWVHVVGGEIYSDNSLINSTSSAMAPRELNGKIRIVPNTYLNVYTQLYLTEPVSLFKNIPHDSSSFCTFPLTDYRQIKLNELNYIDHPLLGVLIQVKR